MRYTTRDGEHFETTPADSSHVRHSEQFSHIWAIVALGPPKRRPIDTNSKRQKWSAQKALQILRFPCESEILHVNVVETPWKYPTYVLIRMLPLSSHLIISYIYVKSSKFCLQGHYNDEHLCTMEESFCSRNHAIPL